MLTFDSTRRGQRAPTLIAAAAAVLATTAVVVAPSSGAPAAASHHAAPLRSVATSTTTTTASTTTRTAAIRSTTTTTTPGPNATTTTTPGSPSRTTTPTRSLATTPTTSHPATTTTTSQQVASSAPSAPCQATTPLGLPGAWKCTFDDEFNGTSLNTSTWVPQLTSNSGYLNGATACHVDNPGTVSVSGGSLNLSARQVAPFTCLYPGGSFTRSYEAGMVSTYGLFDQTDGAFEVNAKLPPSAIDGLQETMWLYPQTLTYGAWPASGEIDFAAFYSQYPGYDVPYIHYANSSSDPNVTAYDCIVNPNTFNTYGVDWTPTSITVLFNGTPCIVDYPTTGGAPFNQPFFIALTQALGVGTNAFSASTPLPATTQVDWVRAWSPS